MPCYQTPPHVGAVPANGSYSTEASCLEACKEGACCETANGTTTCSVKPQCQCQGEGKTFKGVGTTCSPNPCVQQCSPTCPVPASLSITIAVSESPISSFGITRPDCLASFPSFLSGVYVLQLSEVVAVGNSSVAKYSLTTTSIYIAFDWWCSGTGGGGGGLVIARCPGQQNGAIVISPTDCYPHVSNILTTSSRSWFPTIVQYCEGASLPTLTFIEPGFNEQYTCAVPTGGGARFSSTFSFVAQ